MTVWLQFLRLPVGDVEAIQIQFVVHEFGKEPGQMALGQPLIQGRGNQHHRVRVKVLEPLFHNVVRIDPVVGRDVYLLNELGVEEAILRQGRRVIHAPIIPMLAENPG